MLTFSSPDSNQPTLLLTCLDEDEDLRGLRITEEHMDSNGTRVVLEEDYPVYVAWARTPILATAAFSVELRGDGQRKDEELWTDYVIGGLDDVVRKAVDVRPADYMALKRRPDEATGKAMPPSVCPFRSRTECEFWFLLTTEQTMNRKASNCTLPLGILAG